MEPQQSAPSYTVCRSCKTVTAGLHEACPECGSAETEAWPTRVEAEARAAGLWLKEGFSMCDVGDPYWSPKR